MVFPRRVCFPVGVIPRPVCFPEGVIPRWACSLESRIWGVLPLGLVFYKWVMFYGGFKPKLFDGYLIKFTHCDMLRTL